MRIFVRIAAVVCLCVFLMGSAHVSFADDRTDTEVFFSRQEEYSGLIEVPGKGPMRYYAQNDPLWANLIYDRPGNSTSRLFGGGGCGPTASAMAIASLVPEEELSAIADYATATFSLCPCSVNAGKCEKRHARYVLTSQRDFVRFLPLAFADFATGNNKFGVVSRTSTIVGTSSGFLYRIAEVYGMTLTSISDYEAAVAAMKRGDAVVAAAGKGGAFTNTGHYVFLAHIDDEKLYILDPLWREKYDTHQGSRLEIIQPGLVALRHEDVHVANLWGFYIFHKN